MTLICPGCSLPIDEAQMNNRHCNNCSHEWINYHVLPTDDIKIHTELSSCHCNPKIKYESGNTIIIHNSFDGREGVEWANEILGN